MKKCYCSIYYDLNNSFILVPLDVCEFGRRNIGPFKPRVWPKMQQDLKKALSEFSPGRELTVDGINTELAAYTSTIPKQLIEPGIYLLKR